MKSWPSWPPIDKKFDDGERSKFEVDYDRKKSPCSKVAIVFCILMHVT